MGTVFTVVAYGSNRAYLEEVAEQAFGEIDRLDDEMSNYKPSSELSGINRDAFHQEVIVEPELFGLLERCRRYSEDTGGGFDITVGPLMKSWGFFRGRGRLPSSSELAQVLERIGYQHVKFDVAKRTIQFDKPGVEIDLGAIAKGYAVDQVIAILREYRIKQALVSSGTSSVYALGTPPDEPGWKVSVRDPLDPSRAALVLRLQDLSLSVSGNYEKFFKLGGKTYTHIMDPHTGMPVENMLSTVVISPSATDSDALSTSFFVEGVEQSRKYLERYPNLIAVFYLPSASPRSFKQVTLKSPVMRLPAGSFVTVGGD
jgi:FAD:protein FMN transferase